MERQKETTAVKKVLPPSGRRTKPILFIGNFLDIRNKEEAKKAEEINEMIAVQLQSFGLFSEDAEKVINQ